VAGIFLHGEDMRLQDASGEVSVAAHGFFTEEDFNKFKEEMAKNTAFNDYLQNEPHSFFPRLLLLNTREQIAGMKVEDESSRLEERIGSIFDEGPLPKENFAKSYSAVFVTHFEKFAKHPFGNHEDIDAVANVYR
jgi:hypothetical protein